MIQKIRTFVAEEDNIVAIELIDEIINEPIGGAHRNPNQAIEVAGEALFIALSSLQGKSGEDLRNERRNKFLAMGKAGLS